ncbi:MAG: response regulator [Hungatella sp.]|nr:response regulator [Hungatella sp.]MCI9503192.1 response regulator [Hungatella sp.]
MKRILVVDDAELNRELLRDMLKDEYIVEMAADGEEALDKLKIYSASLSAVLLDLQMPKKDGFSVVIEMKRDGWLRHIPVLVISGEFAVEVENQCFELGVSDFIRKPFVDSIVRKRVRNAIELFSSKNQLEQKVEEQEQIIKIQEERKREEKSFNRLMMEYKAAIMGVETRLKVLNEEFSQEYNRNPFESIKSRLKSPASIYEKLERRGFPVSVESIRENLTDVAGLRVICSFPDDIYRLADLLIKQDNIILLRRKDYIKNPKPNGYRSLHLIVDVPIFLSHEKKYMKVEVQLRTIAMDFWASLEHKLKYKKNVDKTGAIEARLKACADSIEALDYQMQEIRDQIDSEGSGHGL